MSEKLHYRGVHLPCRNVGNDNAGNERMTGPEWKRMAKEARGMFAERRRLSFPAGRHTRRMDRGRKLNGESGVRKPRKKRGVTEKPYE